MLDMLRSSWAPPEPDAPPIQSVETLHLSQMCFLKGLGVSRGIHCKYCIAQTTVNNSEGKSFLALAGPFVTVFHFLKSHKRNSALSKVNNKICFTFQRNALFLVGSRLCSSPLNIAPWSSSSLHNAQAVSVNRENSETLAERLEIKSIFLLKRGKNRLRIPDKGVPCHLANAIHLHKANFCAFTETSISHGHMTGQTKTCTAFSFLVQGETGSSFLLVLSPALPLGI